MRFSFPLLIFLIFTPVPLFAYIGCEATGEPVCGYKETCAWNVCTYYRTYENICAMRAEGADFMHAGTCDGAQKTAQVVWGNFFADEYALTPRIDQYDFLTFARAVVGRFLAGFTI